MVKTIYYLDRALVPEHLRGDYQGSKFKAHIKTTVEIPSDAGVWSGGSREVYTAVRVSDGATVSMTETIAPWDPRRRSRTVTLEPGIAVVCHSIFQGKDAGLTFYMHSADVAPLVGPPEPELTPQEQHVLNFAGYQRSYRLEELARQGLTPAQIEEATASCKARGLLNANGAITVKGRNARGG